MIYHYVFDLKKGSSIEEALGELGKFFSDLYEMQDVESRSLQVGGYASRRVSLVYDHVVLRECQEVSLDWKSQWAEFALGFDGELAHIPLGSVQMVLKPGSGFGDCSHPTTRLLLSMMEGLVQGKVVLDVGCGSGVLSIAAALLGAKCVYGIDIELQAVEHSRQNALLNGVEDRVFFSSAVDWQEVDVILMNMIQSEQKVAWESVKRVRAGIMITSGVLSSEADSYKEFVCQNWGWVLKEQRQEEGWEGFSWIR